MNHTTPNTRAIAAAAAAVLVLLWTVSACSKAKMVITPEIAGSDEQLFKLGESLIKKDPEKARIYLRQVIDSFPKSFYAQRAKLAIADSYFAEGDEANMILAAAEYRDFIHSYPFSPSASFCQYRIGLTYFQKALKPGRDQTKTQEALNEFKKVISDYPLSDESKLAQDKVKECEERLAEHDFLIARHYYRIKAFKASVSRLTEILTTYPNYSHMEMVYFFLGDSHFLSRKLQEALPFFTKLVSDYPKSKYAKEATERLKEIEAEKNKVKK
jgi:outer membrane protein assembly factor BamD